MLTENPYVLSESEIKEPPETILGSLRYLGPGFILSASIVGSGELIATTALGAQAGFVMLWVVLFSCLVKVAIQLEFGKHAIANGESTMLAWNRLPGPRWGKANWTIWVWLAIMFTKILQVGGIIGIVALIMQIVVPELFDAMGVGRPEIHVAVYCAFLWVLVSALVTGGYYRPIEKTCLVLICMFTVLTFVSLFFLQETSFAISWAQVGSGLALSLPAAYLGVALGAFGITGVGGDEIMAYNYWLLEKGYAARTGPREDTPEWRRRAKGWIKVMYLDALVSMVVYTATTAAFYLLGAAVLNGQGLIPQGSEVVTTLSRMYTDTLGNYAHYVFLGGAFFVLFSTLLAALAAWTRLFSDAFAQIGVFDFTNAKSRKKAITLFAWLFPGLWTLVYLVFEAPVFMVLYGGVATAIILLIVVFSAVIFRYKRLPAELKPGRIYDVVFWISAIAIFAVAPVSIYRAVDSYREKIEANPQEEETGEIIQAENPYVVAANEPRNRTSPASKTLPKPRRFPILIRSTQESVGPPRGT